MEHTIKVELTIDGKNEVYEFIKNASKTGDYYKLGEAVNNFIKIRQNEWE